MTRESARQQPLAQKKRQGLRAHSSSHRWVNNRLNLWNCDNVSTVDIAARANTTDKADKYLKNALIYRRMRVVIINRLPRNSTAQKEIKKTTYDPCLHNMQLFERDSCRSRGLSKFSNQGQDWLHVNAYHDNNEMIKFSVNLKVNLKLATELVSSVRFVFATVQLETHLSRCFHCSWKAHIVDVI